MERPVHPEKQTQCLAALVEQEFAAYSEVTTDALTGLLNGRGFVPLANFAIVSANRRAEPLTLGWIELKQISRIYERYGRAEGDVALQALAGLLTRVFRDTDLLLRHGEGAFGVLFSDTDESGAWIAMQHLKEQAQAWDLSAGKPWKLQFCWTVVEFNHDDVTDLSGWLRAVDKRMQAVRLQDK
ncbi:diguanylate cyclase [Enterobacteriaceae bacterium RIT691]|nr:diguanylate cyclase [Enterobacteriaceae bacterium RIT691]